MLHSLGLKECSWGGEGGGEKKNVPDSKPPGASVHRGLGKASPLIHSAGMTELLLSWFMSESACVCE